MAAGGDCGKQSVGAPTINEVGEKGDPQSANANALVLSVRRTLSGLCELKTEIDLRVPDCKTMPRPLIVLMTGTTKAHRILLSVSSYAAMIALVVAATILSLCDVTHAAGTHAAGPPRVILLRGWFGVFSMGLDTVTEQLKAQGINAEVAGHLSWQNEVAEILRERAAGRTGPLILVGHSQGANNVIDMARLLESSHVTVDLLITLSPFMQNRVPLNVVKAINYFQAPGWGQPLEAEPGFRGKLINVNLADDPTITHIGMDKSTKVQTEIVREIAAVK
jgi:hypothetical protein